MHKRLYVRVLLVVLATAVLWWTARTAGGEIVALLDRIRDTGPAAPIVFLALYVIAVVALVPGSILTLAAGALFGLGTGVAVVFAAATVGASLAFLIARHLARPYVAERASREVRFRRIDAAIRREGLRMVLLLRLTPVVPFNLLNYALGATAVSFRDFLIGSFGMLPGTLLYVYAGRIAGELTVIAAGGAEPAGAARYLLLGVGFAATAALVWTITRIARDALRESAPDVDSTAGGER